MASNKDNQSTETDGIDQLRQQVRLLMESQGQMMGMIQGALRNQSMAVPTGPARAPHGEETIHYPNPFPSALQDEDVDVSPQQVNPMTDAVTEIVGTGTINQLSNMNTLATEGEAIPSNLVFKKSNPIGTRVPRKLRDKIVTDQYVDMSALLDTKPQPDILSQDQVMYVQVAHNVVRPVPRRKSPQVLDISQWVKAFHLYMAIYTKAHPHEAPNLLQYLMVVESIAEEKGDWRVYDETFRFERAESRTPWEKLDNELYTYVTRKTQYQLAVEQVPSSHAVSLTAVF